MSEDFREPTEQEMEAMFAKVLAAEHTMWTKFKVVTKQGRAVAFTQTLETAERCKDQLNSCGYIEV